MSSFSSLELEDHPLIKALCRIDPLLVFLTRATGQVSVPLPMIRRTLPPGMDATQLLRDIRALVELDAGVITISIHRQSAPSSSNTADSANSNSSNNSHDNLYCWDNADCRLGFPPPPQFSQNGAGASSSSSSLSLHGSTKTAAKRRLAALKRKLKLQQRQHRQIAGARGVTAEDTSCSRTQDQATITSTTTTDTITSTSTPAETNSSTPASSAAAAIGAAAKKCQEPVAAAVETATATDHDKQPACSTASVANDGDVDPVVAVSLELEEEEEKRQALDSLANLIGFHKTGNNIKATVATTTTSLPSSSKEEEEDATSCTATRTAIPTGFLPQQVSYAGSTPAQESEYGELPAPLLHQIPLALRRAFGLVSSSSSVGSIHQHLHHEQEHAATQTTPRRRRLYKHQATAIAAALEGKHCMVCTGTGSGKSLCFWLPVLTAAYNSNSVSLLLFPTKALAQDQLNKLNCLLQNNDDNNSDDGELLQQRIRLAALDGDVPHSQRVAIAEHANVIFTNPDTLHAALLPSWKKMYKKLLSRIEYVVIDEGHSYQGILGAHVKMILSRLVRVAAVAAHQEGLVSTSSSSGEPKQRRMPIFLGASATLPWPEQHFRRLCPIPTNAPMVVLSHVEDDGSPRAAKHFFCWNPPLVHSDGSSTGRVTTSTTTTTMGNHRQQQVKQDEQTITPPLVRATAVVSTTASTTTVSDASLVVALDASSGGQNKRPREEEEEVRNDEVTGNSTPFAVSPEFEGTSSTTGSIGRRQKPRRRRQQLQQVLHNRHQEQEEAVGRDPSILHRRHAADEIALLLARAVASGVRCIAFCKTRNLVEWVFERAQAALARSSTPHLVSRIESYRGGYSMEERRKIEQRLFQNELLGVVGTNALELGVDIGGIDLTLHCGYPSSYASLLQQAGRAGRGKDRLDVPSCAVVVCFNSPSEQHMWRNPKAILSKGTMTKHTIPITSGLVQGHLLCAGEEFPLTGSSPVSVVLSGHDEGSLLTDHELLGGQEIYEEALRELRSGGHCLLEEQVGIPGLQESKLAVYRAHASMRKPWSRVSIRSIEPVNYALIDLSHPGQGGRQDGIHDSQAILDTIPYSRIFYHAHPGAVITHRGRKLKVVSMSRPPPFTPDNFSCRRGLYLASYAEPTNVKYETRPLSNLQITVVKQMERIELQQQEQLVDKARVGGDSASDSGLCWTFAGCGEVSVKRTVRGYKKLSIITRKEIERSELSLPPMEYETFGLWFDTEASMMAPLLGEQYGPGVHALSHALSAVAPVHAPGIVRSDLECDHSFYDPTRLMLFDERAGGSGACLRLWNLFFQPNSLLDAAIELLEECSSCASGNDAGCPACLHASSCINFNMHLSRTAGAVIGRRILSRIQSTELYQRNAGSEQQGVTAILTPRREARRKAVKIAKELHAARDRQFVVGRVSWPLDDC